MLSDWLVSYTKSYVLYVSSKIYYYFNPTKPNPDIQTHFARFMGEYSFYMTQHDGYPSATSLDRAYQCLIPKNAIFMVGENYCMFPYVISQFKQLLREPCFSDSLIEKYISFRMCLNNESDVTYIRYLQEVENGPKV